MVEQQFVKVHRVDVPTWKQKLAQLWDDFKAVADDGAGFVGWIYLPGCTGK